MYIDSLKIKNLRVFKEAELRLWHPGRPDEKGSPTPKLRNVNVLLGNNGAGKTTLLKAVALAALGPMGEKFEPYRLVRRPPENAAAARSAGRPASKARSSAARPPAPEEAGIEADLLLTWQDAPGAKKAHDRLKPLKSSISLRRRGDQEFILARDLDSPDWNPIFEDDVPAFLTVGYGVTRRTDTDINSPTPQQRMRSMPLRHQRVASLFYDNYTLVSTQHWVPRLKAENPGRHKQVVNLLNRVLPEDLELTNESGRADEMLFRQRNQLVPFEALSDGPRAYIGWIADLLYHICFSCPSGTMLVDNCGIVLVDEIDLLLHPAWQQTVVTKLATVFPRLQFIFTTHSPIVVGSVERMNLWICEPDPEGGRTLVTQREIGVHGLNSDHILLTPYFGLTSSRAEEKQKQLDSIAVAAERRTPGKALEFLQSLVAPLEDAAVSPAGDSAPPTPSAGDSASPTETSAVTGGKPTVKKTPRSVRRTRK